MEEQPNQSDKVFETLSNSFCEIVRGRLDFYKTLLTLNTTTLLILIAFSEKLIRPPLEAKWMLVPFILFALSLIFSLYMLKLFGEIDACVKDHYAKVIALISAGLKDVSGLYSIKTQIEDLGKKTARLQNPALYTYLLGMLSLIFLAIVSMFLAK